MLSIKKISENYNIVDLIAIDLGLSPIPPSLFPDKQQEIWNDVMMKVTMKLEDGNWKIHATEKIMMTPQ